MKNNIKVDKDLKKVLIVGANGFLGNNILLFRNEKGTLNNNLFLIASDLNKDNIQQDIPFYYVDITKSNDIIEKIIKMKEQQRVLADASAKLSGSVVKGNASLADADSLQSAVEGMKKDLKEFQS